jgi:xanthine/uracil/vitamin C permease (AzgA family)
MGAVIGLFSLPALLLGIGVGRVDDWVMATFEGTWAYWSIPVGVCLWMGLVFVVLSVINLRSRIDAVPTTSR